MKSISILSGSGVSVASGLTTFKDVDNDWPFHMERRDMLSIYYFKEDPVGFWKAHNYLFPEEKLLNVTPSHFHKLCKEFEEKYKVHIITQNIDGLHQKAGSSNVIELHGNKREFYCVEGRLRGCGWRGKWSEANWMLENPHCPNCNKILKPDSSLYGEGVRDMGLARDIILDSDLFIVAGTSLETSPANELPIYYMGRGKGRSLWVNNCPTPKDYDFEYSFTEGAENLTIDYINNLL